MTSMILENKMYSVYSNATVESLFTSENHWGMFFNHYMGKHTAA